jgi:hypothetical protein
LRYWRRTGQLSTAPANREDTLEGQLPFIKRRPETLDSDKLQKLAGQYQTAAGFRFQILSKEAGRPVYSFPGLPEETLVPCKGLMFRTLEFSDVVFGLTLGATKARASRDRAARTVATSIRTLEDRQRS